MRGKKISSRKHRRTKGNYAKRLNKTQRKLRSFEKARRRRQRKLNKHWKPLKK